MNLCNTVNLCILNGRAYQDKDIGEFTFCNKRGKSSIDFVLCNKHFLYNIHDFYVHPFNGFSDHCVIGFDIRFKKLNDRLCESNVEKGNSFKLSRWNSEKCEEYVSILNSETIQDDITFLSDKLIENMCKEEVDNSIEKLNDIFLTAGKSHIKEVYTGGLIGNKSKAKGQVWYDNDCIK